MRDKGAVQEKSKPFPLSKRSILVAFRLGTLSLALVELAFDDPAKSYLPGIIIAVGAILYTGFKLVHPLRWYMSTLSGIALIIVDVTVCALLLFAQRQIHTPFTLYALNPVLTSALLFPPKVTLITAGVTAVYYTVNFFDFTDSMEHLSSMFLTYIVALGATAWLPYLVNSNVFLGMKSRAVSAERRKLGREIHDGLCQTIYSLRLGLEMPDRDVNRGQRLNERWAQLKGLLDKAEEEARGSLELLRSYRIDRPFLAQMEDGLRHLKSECGISYRLAVPEQEPHLDDLVKLEVLHVYGEALMNVAKHSGARQVTVRVHAPNGHLQVNIADDGCGIADDKLAKGHGLTVMKERAKSLGGRFEVISAPGAGTEIRLEVPRKCAPELGGG